MSRSSTPRTARGRQVSRSARHSPQGRQHAHGVGAASPLTVGAAPNPVSAAVPPISQGGPSPRLPLTAALTIFEGQAVFRLSTGELIRLRTDCRTFGGVRP
jgi:hypothetical protein